MYKVGTRIVATNPDNERVTGTVVGYRKVRNAYLGVVETFYKIKFDEYRWPFIVRQQVCEKAGGN